MTTTCKHGQLARVCERCDDEALLRRALEALQNCANGEDDVLAEQDAEPVAWLYETPMPDGSVFAGASSERLEIGLAVPPNSAERPLYTHPPRREWRGLTDEEIGSALAEAKVAELPDGYEAVEIEIARAIEAALKERNT